MRRFAFILTVLALAPLAAADIGVITVTLDSPGGGSYLSLAGQSNFFQVRTGGGTSGGQLDGVASPGDTIIFNDVFPPPSLDDYLTFGYFGILEVRNSSDDTVSSTALVVAFFPSFGAGEVISSYVPYTAAQLIAAFTGSFDSPEFFAFGDFAGTSPLNNGLIGKPDLAVAGSTLNLVAFGLAGETGITVGAISFSVTASPVPEPASLGLLAIGGLGLVRRRTRA